MGRRREQYFTATPPLHPRRHSRRMLHFKIPSFIPFFRHFAFSARLSYFLALALVALYRSSPSEHSRNLKVNLPSKWTLGGVLLSKALCLFSAASSVLFKLGSFYGRLRSCIRVCIRRYTRISPAFEIRITRETSRIQSAAMIKTKFLRLLSHLLLPWIGAFVISCVESDFF